MKTQNNDQTTSNPPLDGAACSPGSELRPGYKIAFNDYGQVKRWRILRIQNGLALVTEGWGVHKLLSVASIAAAPYIIEQTRFPWYLRPFYLDNEKSAATGSERNAHE